MTARCWLMKSEPSEASFEDFWMADRRTMSWWGVRNYQARNFMRDLMRPGDAVLFYHSNCPRPGIVGRARVASSAYPDALQFDPASPYFDARSDPASPRWLAVDVEVLEPWETIGLAELRNHPETASMRVLARGNRLSITPVTESELNFILLALARPRAISRIP